MNKAVNHRNMRILLILILSIFSFTFCFKVTNLEKTFATDTNIPKISVESKTVHRGQTFTIDVNLSNNKLGLISLLLKLDYDNKVMKLTNIVKGDALDSLTLTTTNPDTEEGYSISEFQILWDGSTQDFTNGKIITFVFDSYIDAKIYEEDEKNYYDIKLTFDKQNTNTQYKTPIDVDITNGKVKLIRGEYQAIYRDYDGKVLFEQDYNDNENEYPEYPYENPFRKEDEKYSYEFIRWKGVPSDDIKILIFEADYKLTPKIYTIFYYVDGINGYPDGVIDQNDYFDAAEIPFGTYIELPTVPKKQFYEFFGWYEDKNFSSVSPYALMPAENITLYAYYKFDIREDNIPIISLEDVIVNDKDENETYAVVSAKILKNSGINNMVLTLKYDKDALEFENYEKSEILLDMDLTVTGTDVAEDFIKFYFNAGKNNYETGEFLKLYFKVKKGTPDGVYDVCFFEYDYHKDASYYATDTEIKYTMIEFYKGEVPIGLKYHWNTNLSTDRGVDITSKDGESINVFLEVDLVTDKVDVDENLIDTHVGDNMFMSSAYEIKLVKNRKEVQPNTTLTIKIKLTEKEQKSNIKFYYLNDNYELVSHDFKIENGELIFTTDHLSNWVIFSDYDESNNYNNDLIFGSRGNAVILIGMPLLLAIATMLYAIRLRQQLNKKNKEAHND